MTSVDGVRFSRRRRAAYLALTCAWFGLIVLGAVELFLRARWTPPSARSYESFGAHPLYVTGPLPGSSGRHVRTEYDVPFEINQLGFRGPLPDLANESKPRVLVVGDSQTFGLGVPNGETFCDRLREKLGDVELINAGSNGYGTREQLAVIHHLGEAWRPDLILLVCFWNDLEDNIKRDVPAFDLDESQRVVRTDPYDESFNPLALRETIEAHPRQATGLRLRSFIKESLRGLRYRTLGIKRRRIRTLEQQSEAFEVFEGLLAIAKRRSDELESHLVVVALPDHNQVDPEAVIRNIGPVNFEIQERLFRTCADLGIPTIDLLPPLQKDFEEEGEALYYYADKHLRARGHRIIGDVLAQACRETLTTTVEASFRGSASTNR